MTLPLHREAVKPAVVRPMFPLRVRGLSYAVGSQRLIDTIDLTVEAGVRTVIMGPNGAGKSLLLRLLHGLLKPTAGTIHWGKMPPGERVRQRQAMVFQRPVLLRRSVRANMRFVLGLTRRSRREREDRLQQVLDLANLSALADRPARVLSSGEQQRLAIARALALDPAILFLDEPTASLDPAAVAAIEALLHAAHTHGTQIMLVTHDLGQARRLADEVIFVHHGRLVEHTPAVRFFAEPASDAARAYLAGHIVL